MRNLPSRRSCLRARSGFTLVELLCVMGIMAILLAVAIPSIEGMNLSIGIGQGGQVVTDQIALARQMASARNVTVELRLIQVPARSAVGYTAIQLWSPATATPLSRVVTMPDGIAISQEKTVVSTLFATYQQPSPLKTMPAGSPETGDSYVSFTISPSGMVGPLSATGTAPNMNVIVIGVLPASNAADITLTKANGQVRNYVLIQLNPLTAATVAYRP